MKNLILSAIVCVTTLLLTNPVHAAIPKVGEKAPVVEGKNQDSQIWKLNDSLGKKAVLLYFIQKTTRPVAPKRPAVCVIA